MMDYWENADHSWSEDSQRIILTQNDNNKAMFNYIQEIGYFKAHKPYFTERADLPSYLVKYTLSGTGLLLYNGQEHFLKAGDVFFIDCRSYQYYRTESTEPWEMDWVHFNGANVPAFYREFLRSGNNVFHTSAPEPLENPLHLIMTQLLHNQKRPNARTDFESSVLLHELMNELIIQKYQLNFAETDIPAYILEMQAYLTTHFREVVTLDDLEKEFHLNKYQLNKNFSRYIGTPPIEYQINLKISYAKELLRLSDLSVQEIALKSGIDNASYFSRLFKKKTGLVPVAYRKIGN